MTKQRTIWLATALLLLCFALLVMSARLKAPTYDEQGYIARGYAYVKLGDLHIRIGTPIGLNALNALPLLSLPGVRLPVESPSWSGTDFHPIGERFLWHVNPNADQILFLARLPTIYLTLLLASFVFRWARALYGPWGGLLSLALCTLDPNIIAHGRLVTTDLGSAALIYITTYWAWRFLRRPNWPHLLATGVFLGLAQGSKFSALVYLPILALIFVLRAFGRVPFALMLPGYSPLERRKGPQPWWGRLFWLAVSGALVGLVALLTLWALYGFELGPVPALAEAPVFPAWASRLPLPAPSHLDQLLDISGRLAGEEGRLPTGFLLGELYPGGRWEYFVVAFGVKTPLPTLIFLVGALLLAAVEAVPSKRRSPVHRPTSGRLGFGRRVGYALWLPPLAFFAISLQSHLNLGYRYLLPMLPFLFVIAGRVGPWAASRPAAWRGIRRVLPGAVTVALLAWLAWGTLSLYPHYLAYFNELAGGPDGGWRVLVDSNLDWGQDLKGLKRWMDARAARAPASGEERLKLAYLGEAYPTYYGLDFDPLPSWPDRWQHPFYHDLYPQDPAPGLYAISANLLQGRNLADPETYAWFRAQTPVDKVGYSIFIYEVPIRSPAGAGPAVLALSGVDLADVRLEDYARLGTNDVRVLWFDARRALLGPDGDAAATWFYVSDETPLHPALAGLVPGAEAGVPLCTPATTRSGRPYCIWPGTPLPAVEDDEAAVLAQARAAAADAPVWHLPAASFTPGDPEDHGARLAYPVRFGDTLELVGYDLQPTAQARDPERGQQGTDLGRRWQPGEALTLVTHWRVRAPAQAPLKLFLHLLDAQSGYVTGEDRLDVWYDNWQPGDLFSQVHEVSLPAGTPPGRYQVEIGVYDPATMLRLPVTRDGAAIADRVLLVPLDVEQGD